MEMLGNLVPSGEWKSFKWQKIDLDALSCYLTIFSFICKVASESFSPKVIIPFATRASQHGPFLPPALENFFERNLNFKGFHEVSKITARAGTARDTSGTMLRN